MITGHVEWDTHDGIIDEDTGRTMLQLVAVGYSHEQREIFGEMLAKKINDDLDSGAQWTTL